MGNRVSRRDVLRQSAIGVSAVALSGASSARAFAVNDQVQLGWIGCGGRSSGLMQHMMDNAKNFRVAGVCDLIPERMEKAKRFWSGHKPNGYLNFHEMFEKEKLDGVMAVVQVCKHADVIVPVLEAGYHTFGEKPIDKDVESIDALTIAARKAWKEKGKFFQIGTQRRYHPTYQACMKAIHEGILGKITFMQGGWHWSSNPAQIPTDCDGGRLIEQASHHTDVMAWAMKDVAPATCVAMASNLEGRNPEFSETHSSTTFQWADGTMFSYTHLWCLPGRYDQEILTVFGEKGAVDLNQGKYYGRDEKTKDLGEASGKAWDRGSPEELVDFVENIRTGGKRLPNANVETGRICSLMCVMGRMAMVNAKKNAYEPRVIHWKDLGSKTDLPSA